MPAAWTCYSNCWRRRGTSRWSGAAIATFLAKGCVFSHLIRQSYPGETDTPAAFKAAVMPLKLGEKRLLELAFYAPQWARHVAEARGREGLYDALWWLHAHTKDSSWDNDWIVPREMRDIWKAEIAKHTELTPDDLWRARWTWRGLGRRTRV